MSTKTEQPKEPVGVMARHRQRPHFTVTIKRDMPGLGEWSGVLVANVVALEVSTFIITDMKGDIEQFKKDIANELVIEFGQPKDKPIWLGFTHDSL